MSLVTEHQITEVAEDQVGETITRTSNSRAARHAPGIALASVVHRVSNTDGKKVAESIKQVAVAVNEHKPLTDTAVTHVEKFLALLLPKIASVAKKAQISFAKSFERIVGHSYDFERRAIDFCEKREGLLFSPTTVALLAQGRAQNHLRGDDIVRYAAMAEYMCRELIILANSNSQTNHEITRADIKCAFRTMQFSNLCRKLGFGLEGQ